MRKTQISPDMLTPIKPLETKKISNTEKTKKTIKIKEDGPIIIDEEYNQKVIEEIIEETRRTESEITIENKSDHCIVHKGTITGINYVCPKCKSKYCLKCINVEKEGRKLLGL